MPTVEEVVQAAFDEAGLEPLAWSCPANAAYAVHDHPAAKLIFCTQGLITFTLHQDGKLRELTLKPGDRLDLPAQTGHSAVAGPEGVTCWEAFRGS